LPPYADASDTVNDREVVPVAPQLALQVLHEDQSPTQSTGHSSSLQLWLIGLPSTAAHGAPPNRASCDTWYVLL
jgi:hypothetical protein